MELNELAVELGVRELPTDLLAGEEAWRAQGLNARERRRLAAAIALGRYALRSSKPERPRLLRAAQIIEVLVPHLAGLDHEEYWVVLLSARLQLIDAVKVASGGLTQCSVTAREIFRPAVLRNAAAIACAHNHPSGDPTPSGEDGRLQIVVDEGGVVLGIRVIDHIVIGRGSAHSAVEGTFALEGATP